MRRSLFIFARHGETDWNAAGRWQGQTDVSLNLVGREQARALAAGLRGEAIRAVGSSDLSRARQTAEIVAADLGLALGYIDAAFRERAYGVFEGLTRAECMARYPAEWPHFDADPGRLPPGVEPLDQVAERMLRGLRTASEQMGSPALIVSHGRAIRSLVGTVTGAPVEPLGNGAAYRFVVEDGVPIEAAPLARVQ
jgi:probable phosphoglycerate mutase